MPRILMPTDIAERPKQEVFDTYWQTREYTTADARTRQRAVNAAGMLNNKKGRLLDVGCGRGFVSGYFTGLGYDVLGIDVSPMSVEWTKKQGVAARIHDLEAETIEDHFDVIICLETLQYLRDPVAVLAKLRDAVAPGGEMVISLPCEYHFVRRLSILFSGRGPGGIDFPLTVLYPREHRRLFSRAGLRITDVRPLSIIPPGWRLLRGPGQLIARLAPSLFALSVMYRLVKKD